MARLPRLVSFTLPERVVRLDDRNWGEQKTIIVDSLVTDTGHTGYTYILRPGFVLGYDGTNYVAPASATADAAASITSSSHSDGNGTIKIVGNYGTISVTTTTGTGTEANNATDLNADADFAAHYTASSGGGELTIASNEVGAEQWFYVHADTMATASFSEGLANAVQGTDADYVIIDEYVNLQDETGTAIDQEAQGHEKGYWDESQLIGLTADVKAYFIRKGVKFG